MQEVWTRIRHSRTAMVGLAILVFFIGMAVFAQWLPPVRPAFRGAGTRQFGPNRSPPPRPPRGPHPFGNNGEGGRHFFPSLLGAPNKPILGGLLGDGAQRPWA